MSDQALEEAVVHTLQYFALFHYPLTTEELFRYLWRMPTDYASFCQWIHQYQGVRFERTGAFWHIPGAAAQVATRQAAVAYVEQKTRLAMRGSGLLQWVPFVRGVFVCNSVAMNVATKDSDIDLFIVTENNRTWLVRLLVTLTLSLWRLRRHGGHIANRLCLSFYSDLNHVDMQRVALGPDDIYLAYWLVQLVPVYDPQNVAAYLVQHNSWMHTAVPNATSTKPENKQAKKQMIRERVLAGRLGEWCEQVAKRIQMRHIAKTSAGKNRPTQSAVVIEDGFLKFHETDKREEFKQRWQQSVVMSLKS